MTAHALSSRDDSGLGNRLGIAARPLVAAVRLYQQVRAGRPSPCRFTPSCSTYALESLQQHGAVRGTALALRRLTRCHPWGGSGYDPVPPPHVHDEKVP